MKNFKVINPIIGDHHTIPTDHQFITGDILKHINTTEDTIICECDRGEQWSFLLSEFNNNTEEI